MSSDELNRLNEQLWAAAAETKRIQAAIDKIHADDLQARVDAMVDQMGRDPNPNTLVEWIESILWDGSADEFRHAIIAPINAYYLAAVERMGRTS